MTIFSLLLSLFALHSLLLLIISVLYVLTALKFWGLQHAASSTSTLTPAQLIADAGTSLGRAVALIDCRQANCAVECGL